jgi:hypothetical protein
MRLSCQIEATTAETKTKNQNEKMKLIESNTTLTARSICDYDCIYSLTVLNRKGSFATVRFQGNEKRVKVRNDGDCEYLRPDNYSMAPIFRAA